MSKVWQHTVTTPDTVLMRADGPDRMVVWAETEIASEPETLLEAVRDTAWSMLAIPYNPYGALLKFAQRRGMGAPLTTEFDFTFEGVLYRGQGFALGIAYAEVNHWDAVWSVLW